jgi:hypothetical protein
MNLSGIASMLQLNCGKIAQNRQHELLGFATETVLAVRFG